MKHISVLIKPASSLCNIRCTYCFYADVSSMREVKCYGKMKRDVSEKMIENIFMDLEDGDQLTLAFQGGEPTLAGVKYYQELIQLVSQQNNKVTVHYSIQTSGMVVTDEWCQLLKEHHFLVGLSIDGHATYHDLNRVDNKGKGTFQRVMKTKALFDAYQIEYNVLCVLTNPLAKEAKKVFQFIKENHISYVQFIPCLEDFGTERGHRFGLTPKRFATFYHQMLTLWLEELRKGHYISIKLFDDIFNLLVNKQVTACGLTGNCQIQYVIESDGSVYPCDFYVLDEYKMGYIQEKGLKELFEQDVSFNFLCEERHMDITCKACNFQPICGGGCKRMKDAMYVDTKGFCGYQQLLKEYVPKIPEVQMLIGQMK